MWGLRLRSLLRGLRYLASVDCPSSWQIVSEDDVLQRFRGQRHLYEEEISDVSLSTFYGH
jgi:hypothetical protein